MKTSKLIFLVLISLITEVMVLVLFTKPLNSLKVLLPKIGDQADKLEEVNLNKDWVGLVNTLSKSPDLVKDIENIRDQTKYLRHVPIIRNYFNDTYVTFPIATEILTNVSFTLDQLSPFKEIFGYGNTGDNQEQMKELLESSPQIIPILKEFIDANRPLVEGIFDLDLRKYRLHSSINDKINFIIDHKAEIGENLDKLGDILTQIPSLLGEPSPKSYLILFQNDKELRPTGGFITAFALMNIESGQVAVSEAKNIYELNDPGSGQRSPLPIAIYLNQPNWFIRDMNFSPDYIDSMATFYEAWINLGEPRVDGIFSIDTQFVESLLSVLGPVEIDGYNTDFSGWNSLPDTCKRGGTTFTAENVVCRLELYSERITQNDAQRKDIIGSLMLGIFNQVMNVPAKELTPFGMKVIEGLNQKHLLLSFTDMKTQSIVEGYNWAGRIEATDSDYLYINDANLGGLKSDMYLKRSVSQEYTKNSSGDTIKTVTITYDNTAPYDGWLNAKSRDYVRVYVPLGSELISSEGGSVGTGTFEDLGKTVFDNFIQVYPLSSETISFTYKLPKGLNLQQVLIQKQPGLGEVNYHVIIEGNSFDDVLISDLTINLF